MSSKGQQEWHVPENKLPLPTTLKLYNLLTRTKTILTNSLSQELIDQVKAALNDFAQTKLGVTNNGPALNLAPSKEDPKYLLYMQIL
ncbi:unnamed protein product [Rhizophagus irregularis]|nr:unnamed protein product [Rhizophagus irregularis]